MCSICHSSRGVESIEMTSNRTPPSGGRCSARYAVAAAINRFCFVRFTHNAGAPITVCPPLFTSTKTKTSLSRQTKSISPLLVRKFCFRVRIPFMSRYAAAASSAFRPGSSDFGKFHLRFAQWCKAHSVMWGRAKRRDLAEVFGGSVTFVMFETVLRV